MQLLKGVNNMYYINLKTIQHGIETVDEFETRKEALNMLYEYNHGCGDLIYYLSTRSTKEWRSR